MADITQLPTAGIPHQITAREIWAQPEPTDLMVWSVCVYVRWPKEDRCKGCLAWDDREGEKLKSGCRAWAEEACRVVLAAKARSEAAPETQKARPARTVRTNVAFGGSGSRIFSPACIAIDRAADVESRGAGAGAPCPHSHRRGGIAEG